MADTTPADIGYVPPAEVEEAELYHAKSWITKYVFSQDAKVIAIQYSLTAISVGMVALVLSWLMRLQLGFPDTFSFIDAGCGASKAGSGSSEPGSAASGAGSGDLGPPGWIWGLRGWIWGLRGWIWGRQDAASHSLS